MYNIDNDNYLGSAKDMSGKEVQGFRVDEEIHLVYHNNTPELYSTSASITEIKSDLDKYLWTPYAAFASSLEDYTQE